MSGAPPSYKICPVCSTSAPVDAQQCLGCGHTFGSTPPPPPPNQTQFYQQPYGPYAQQPDQSSLIITLLLWFFLGGFGAHRLYLGHTGTGIAMLVLQLIGLATVCIVIGIPFLVAAWIWWIVDLVLILTRSLYFADGRRLL